MTKPSAVLELPAAVTADDGTDPDLRIEDVARILALSVRTVHRFIHADEHPLPVHRFGRAVRIRRSAFERWRQEREQPDGAAPPASDQPVTDVRRIALAMRGYKT